MRTRACMWVPWRIQHPTRMRHIVTSIVASRSSTSEFSTLSHKRCSFREKTLLNKMYVFIFSTTFIWNISHSKRNLTRYCQKCRNFFIWSTRYSCQILMKLKFSWQSFEKKAQIWRLIKIRAVGAELYLIDRRTDEQTDMRRLIITFRNFANAPKKFY